MANLQFAIDEDLRLIHNLGVAQILMHCGPQAFQEEPLLTAYRSCRALLVSRSSLGHPFLKFQYHIHTVSHSHYFPDLPILRHSTTHLP